MKVFITGMTGACGRFMQERLSNVPDLQVRGIGRRATDQPHCDRVDMRDATTLRHILTSFDPDIIFNFASVADVSHSWLCPWSVIENNVLATEVLLETVSRYVPNARIVHCSSSEVYGNPHLVPITEQYPLNPVNPYAVSKALQDRRCEMYPHLNIVRTRAFGYINPLRADLCSSSFARQIVEIERGERAILHYGNLESIRTFCDVRDVIEAYWQIALHGRVGEVYNIGSTEPVSIRDVLERLLKKASYPVWIEGIKELLRPHDVTQQIPSIAKLHALTGWKPTRTLDESLDWLLAWYRENRS